MIPSQRTFLLLGFGIGIAAFVATFFTQQLSLIVTGVFNLVLLTLVLFDGFRTRFHRVEISRYPLGKLSIARDNAVTLSVRSPAISVRIIVRDTYPPQFKASERELQANLSPNSAQELTYTVYPENRGEFKWGSIQVRRGVGDWGGISGRWRNHKR